MFEALATLAGMLGLVMLIVGFLVAISACQNRRPLDGDWRRWR